MRTYVDASERADQQVEIGERGSSRATGAVQYARMLMVTKGPNGAGVPGWGGQSVQRSARSPFPFFIPHKLGFPPPPALYSSLSACAVIFNAL